MIGQFLPHKLAIATFVLASNRKRAAKRLKVAGTLHCMSFSFSLLNRCVERASWN